MDNEGKERREEDENNKVGKEKSIETPTTNKSPPFSREGKLGAGEFNEGKNRGVRGSAAGDKTDSQ